ncbi:phosphomevalonate kinase [soil metagenome]
MSLTASAPGKLMLSGEYAVLDGAPALMVAVNRRAIARIDSGGARGSSPFLLAVASEIAAQRGDGDPAARLALQIAVDSRGFYDGTNKLGLGSSAAVTAAAVYLALATTDEHVSLADVHSVAAAAHGRAQAPMGARGSGAAVAAAIYDGVIEFSRGGEPLTTSGAWRVSKEHFATKSVANAAMPELVAMARAEQMQPSANIQKRVWPKTVRLMTFFTGTSASTTTLVQRVQAARAASPSTVEPALAALADASRAACGAVIAPPDLSATALIGALALGAAAMDRLVAATGVELVPDVVVRARQALARYGGTAKTTGAGGGDLAIAVMPSAVDATEIERVLIQVGCRLVPLSVDETGVDLRPDAS